MESLYTELQYFDCSFTNNIYSSSLLRKAGTVKLLLADGNNVLSLDSERGTFAVEPLPLPQLPSNSEIVSIHAYSSINRGSMDSTGKVTIAVTHVEDKIHSEPSNETTMSLVGDSTGAQMLMRGRRTTRTNTETDSLHVAGLSTQHTGDSIPSATDDNFERVNNGNQVQQQHVNKVSSSLSMFSVDFTPQSPRGNCVIKSSGTTRLDFLPYGMQHIDAGRFEHKERLLLVSGSDHGIHTFQHNTKRNKVQLLDELNGSRSMVRGLLDLESTPIAVQVVKTSGDNDGSPSSMSMAIGLENGSLQLLRQKFDADNQESKYFQVVFEKTDHVVHFDSPVVAICPFYPTVAAQATRSHMSLAAGTGIDGNFVFREFSTKIGLRNAVQLPDPVPTPDCTLCVHAVDFDCDDAVELYVGTFGNEMLVFGSKLQGETDVEDQGDANTTWTNVHTQEFAEPVYAIHSGDFLKDGAMELVVNTVHGVHVIQPSLNKLMDQLLLNVSDLNELLELENSLSY